MKKACVLAVLVVILAGCSHSSQELERGLELRSRLQKAASTSFEAEITADYGEKIYTFSMSCEGKNNGDLLFTVTKPETIAGITGRFDHEGGALTFDEHALHLGLLADGQTTPVAASWIVYKSILGGYLTCAGLEDGSVRLTIDDSYADDALTVDVWLDENDLPASAQILYKGRSFLSLSIKNFQIL